MYLKPARILIFLERDAYYVISLCQSVTFIEATFLLPFLLFAMCQFCCQRSAETNKKIKLFFHRWVCMPLSCKAANYHWMCEDTFIWCNMAWCALIMVQVALPLRQRISMTNDLDYRATKIPSQ